MSFINKNQLKATVYRVLDYGGTKYTAEEILGAAQAYTEACEAWFAAHEAARMAIKPYVDSVFGIAIPDAPPWAKELSESVRRGDFSHDPGVGLKRKEAFPLSQWKRQAGKMRAETKKLEKLLDYKEE